ncbi:MAG: nucleotidyltransferase domain-containing protein [Candidatus Hadarchaeales archaeon]
MVKPERVGEVREVIYSEERWTLLQQFRKKALTIMEKLEVFDPIVHGSVARGDVDKESDIDIFLQASPTPYIVEVSLARHGFEILRREIVMATPWQLPKAHIYLDEKTSVTVPLLKPTKLELEFYHFGGALDFNDLRANKRAPGVDKRLMLIEPTPQGHIESSIIGKEEETAKLLGVSPEIVRERVQVLMKRAEVGHTGLFIKRELLPHESIEEVFKKEVLENPLARMRLSGQGK